MAAHSQTDADRIAGRTSPHPNRKEKGAHTPTSPALPPTSLSIAHISEALAQSSDSGKTLDLTHRNLTDVGELGAQELATIGRKDIVEDESSVLRMTLGYNRLATLPTAFALLSRLRYLNLKNNNFSIFPDVLTVMPSLEVLDLSRNKIKRLPSQPGSLISLQVFCLSRNKLTRLPAYMSEFVHLSILKTDHNPLEWPPKAVMQPKDGLEDLQVMRTWIHSVQTWISDNSGQTGGRKASDESLLSEPIDLGGPADDSINSWTRFPMLQEEFGPGHTPHARSFSMDSDFSAYSIPEAPEVSTSLDSPTDNRPPPLHLGNLPTYTSNISPRSPDSYLPTPEASVSSTDDDATAVVGSLSEQQQHARNASYAGGSREGERPGLSGKKSLPDLRTAKFNFGGAKKPPNMPTRAGTLGPEMLNGKLEEGFFIPSPSSHREDSGSSDGRPIPRPRKLTYENSPITRFPPTADNPAPSMDVERNSYFRRLSTMPFSTVSAIPPALLSLIDAARSILFAVCQVYQTLQHYTVYAIDERLPSVLRKVLDPASQYMMQLINALDRFDSMSRRTLPSPAVCRSVVECCKDTVVAFGKAVNVLALQLKVLATHDDVRYLRQMLLVLYGATAEISHAWQAMAPHIDAVKPLLQEHRKPPKAHPTSQTLARSPGSAEPASRSHAPAPPFPNETNANARSPQTSTPNAQAGRTRMARRHAGSFSSKDVEIGKKLPSYDIPQTPSVRVGLRQMSTSHIQAGSSSGRPLSNGDHSRQGSQTSLKPSSSGQSSPSVQTKAPNLIQPSSKTLVDQEALDAMRVAVEAAPAVWSMMDEILIESQDKETLAKAKVLTYRLSTNLSAPIADTNRKALTEDARSFVKTVVRLSNIVKTHAVSSDLRSRMVKLTNSTEEFVILLHVSSFSASNTPVPHSPFPNNGPTTTALLAMPEDTRFGGALSRSRSATASVNSKLAVSAGPKSALPTQSFNVPWSSRSGREWDADSLG